MPKIDIAKVPVENRTNYPEPYKAVVANEKGKIERTSSLLAFAEDGSSDWSVMDGSGQSFKSLKFVLPGYNGHPRIPPALSKVVTE